VLISVTCAQAVLATVARYFSSSLLPSSAHEAKSLLELFYFSLTQLAKMVA